MDSDRRWAINLILSSQHPEGGFGSSPGQIAHLADTFSSISALAILLGEAEPQLVKETWAQVKVEGMYHWMLRLKQPDGTFAMSQADIYKGERDVRAIYCAVALATLLNFLTPDLARGLPESIATCQTYEGGLSSASQLVGIRTHSHRIPLGEAHGGYTSCGVLSHFLLKSLERSFSIVPLDYSACLRWLSRMQALPIEGGGFRGRTNKLVDGCYNWWCAGLFPVIATLIVEDGCDSEEIFEPHDRQSLQEYALLVSQLQSRTGGLREGPLSRPDLYHTHYILCGLSAAQHLHRFSPIQAKLREQEFDARSSPPPRFMLTEETIEQATNRARSIYSRALSWEVRDQGCLVIGEPQNKLVPIDPVFNIRSKYVHTTMTHFYLRPV
ncbi:hypothetical protein CROQUDRAFT_494278 [Cronartium quercuum f. sp. fusiforme G11]|uniref:Prenyltransferase alpha-alpha toroid domain-containing protein n=1 Tax=Cronartium quercuum f. sp. fusiforme G11 TaxID=708437 RepID=A0A9P6NNV3_9BASI|nr:hypothetical protein CROQUDRAFT_494278 [Cronartium quercuum f. sp. fusiforme G11]